MAQLTLPLLFNIFNNLSMLLTTLGLLTCIEVNVAEDKYIYNLTQKSASVNIALLSVSAMTEDRIRKLKAACEYV